MIALVLVVMVLLYLLDLETMLRLREVSVVSVVFDASACFTVSGIDTKLIDEERVT